MTRELIIGYIMNVMETDETRQSLKAVLFDFGGVIADDGFREGLRAIAEEQGLDPAYLAREGMDAVYDSGFVLGTGSEADFWQLLRRRTGLVGDDQALTETILTGFQLRPWMIDVVLQLHEAGYTTAILSDQTHWLDELDARTPFMHAFDYVYNSYYLGKGKRDPSLFDDIVHDLSVAPEQAIFIDDDTGNVANARQQGLWAILYQDHQQFMNELKQYDLL
jgi:putative hydrolase of the HAD superfamily